MQQSRAYFVTMWLHVCTPQSLRSSARQRHAAPDAGTPAHARQSTLRLRHLQPFEARSLLAEEMVAQPSGRAASTAITEALLNRLECSRPLCSAPKR